MNELQLEMIIFTDLVVMRLVVPVVVEMAVVAVTRKRWMSGWHSYIVFERHEADFRSEDRPSGQVFRGFLQSLEKVRDIISN
jgi:hypothetical protein